MQHNFTLLGIASATRELNSIKAHSASLLGFKVHQLLLHCEYLGIVLIVGVGVFDCCVHVDVCVCGCDEGLHGWSDDLQYCLSADRSVGRLEVIDAILHVFTIATTRDWRTLGKDKATINASSYMIVIEIAHCKVAIAYAMTLGWTTGIVIVCVRVLVRVALLILLKEGLQMIGKSGRNDLRKLFRLDSRCTRQRLICISNWGWWCGRLRNVKWLHR